MNDRAGTTPDGFDRTVVLDCGDTFRARDTGSSPWGVGHWTSCDKHSFIVGYDPDYGTPKYNRDRRVVEVRVDE